MRDETTEAREVIERVKREGQGHLLRFWDELNSGERELLIRDICTVDLSILRHLGSLLAGGAKKVREVRPPGIIAIPESRGELAREREAFEAGEMHLRSSKVAVFTAAGGQSSRLGIEAPKGTFPVTPVRKKSLFQVFAEKIRNGEKRYGVKVPWMIMVSDTNGEETESFFRKNGYFGLEATQFRFIEQGMFPAVDEKGKIYMKEKHRLFLSPSGHGGTFAALGDSGALGWLEGLGVEEIFYFQVDNVLANVLDPVFIGYHALGRCGMSSKCVRKKNFEEKLGVFALLNGKPAVVEYSELETIEKLLGKGSAALFTAGNIAIHMLNLAFAAEQSAGGNRLPLHLARKVIPYVDYRGERVEPSKPNGFKFETFIFDALQNAMNTVIMEVRREDEFSPLKNRSGDDSPETVFSDQVLLFARWFEGAGIQVPRSADGFPRHALEVSPLFALTGEEFSARIAGEKYRRRYHPVSSPFIPERDTYIE